MMRSMPAGQKQPDAPAGNSWRSVLISVLFAGLATVGFAFYGVPAMAGWLARHTPSSMAAYTTRQTLEAMDNIALNATKLPPATKAHYRDLFEAVAARAPRGANGYRLVSGMPQPSSNAFALPDGA